MNDQFACARKNLQHHPLLTIRNCSIVGACALVTAVVVIGCDSLSGGLGVTPGGPQDIAAARAVIERGGIPDPDSITVEGFLSEHDVPIIAPDGAGELYITAATAWNADFDVFTPLATVALGMGTTIDADTFQRNALNVCVVIDRSGSMADAVDVRSGTTKLDAVKIAIDRLLAQLDEDDRISIVAFNSDSRLILSPTPGDDLATIKSSFDTLTATGGTDLAKGMLKGFNVVQNNSSTDRSDRIIVFTDALLSGTNLVSTRRFLGVMENFAQEGIGATLLGVGIDFGHEIADEVSRIRGGNYFFLSDFERIVSVFDDEFDFMVTPVAQDVVFNVNVPFEWDVVDAHGLPVDEPLGHVLTLEVPTVFLSARNGGGAIIVRLRPGALTDFDQQQVIADVALSYTSRDGQEITETAIEAALPTGINPDTSDRYFESDSVRRSALLVNTALVLKNASEDASFRWTGDTYHSADYDLAIARLEDFLPYFDEMAEGLEDKMSNTSRRLSQERALVARLLANIIDRVR